MLLYRLYFSAILHLQYLWNPVWIFLEPLISSKNLQSVKRIHGVRISKNLPNSKAFNEPVKGKKRVEVGKGREGAAFGGSSSMVHVACWGSLSRTRKKMVSELVLNRAFIFCFFFAKQHVKTERMFTRFLFLNPQLHPWYAKLGYVSLSLSLGHRLIKTYWKPGFGNNKENKICFMIKNF